MGLRLVCHSLAYQTLRGFAQLRVLRQVSDPYPVHLSAADRQRADHVYDGFGLAVAAYEASPEVSPFTSKYDNVQAGTDKFTPQEERGYALFRGKARMQPVSP